MDKNLVNIIKDVYGIDISQLKPVKSILKKYEDRNKNLKFLNDFEELFSINKNRVVKSIEFQSKDFKSLKEKYHLPDFLKIKQVYAVVMENKKKLQGFGLVATVTHKNKIEKIFLDGGLEKEIYYYHLATSYPLDNNGNQVPRIILYTN